MSRAVTAKTFEIGYKGYYREHSEWYTDHIKAANEKRALKEFAKEHRFKLVNYIEPENCRWEEGEWFMSLRYIKEVKIQPCSHCGGKGVVSV